MNILEFTIVVWFVSLVAGFLGSLTGMGGGVVIVPILTVALGVDIRYAIGASIISVIATSSAAAAAFVKDGYTNLRIGIFLEIATILGALAGAFYAAKVPTSTLAIIFGAVLLYSAYLSSRPQSDSHPENQPDSLARCLKLDSNYPTPEGPKPYYVRAVRVGFSLMFLAGSLSGLLGIGSGAIKVLAMDRAMRIPFKVSTTTSNFMIGVTAAASAGVYLTRGYIDPGLAMPVMLGVLVGSLLGARKVASAKTQVLRLTFTAVLLLLAVEMIYNGLIGRL